HDTERIGKGGRRVPVSISASRLPDESGEIGGVAFIYRDITERKRAEERISYLSQHDLLTGLPNRTLFRDRVEVAVARARRNAELAGLLLLNVDRFGEVNRSLGQDAGDQLLQQLAARLKEQLREIDTIARLGADEFAILVEGVPGAED